MLLHAAMMTVEILPQTVTPRKLRGRQGRFKNKLREVNQEAMLYYEE